MRRAYVAKLRAIDVERDPAAFIRLREAYETALAAAANGMFDDDDDAPVLDDEDDEDAIEGGEDEIEKDNEPVARTVTREIMPPDIIMPPPPRPPVALVFEEDPEEAIDDALEREGVLAAWHVFEHHMATGAIGLREQSALTRRLVAAALVETGPGSAAPFRTIIATIGASKSGREDDLADYRGRIAARLAAEDWLDRIAREAGKRAFGAKRFDIVAARVALGRKANYRRSHPQLAAIQRLLADYRRHSAWLSVRLNDERLAMLAKRAESDLVARKRRDKIFAIAVIAFFALDILYVLFFAN